jgi:isoquinoline 1-oxidoreductase beta subunit
MPQDFGCSGDTSVSRRHFLKAGAAFGGGLMIGWVPEAQSAADAELFAPNAFIRLDRQGRVTVVSPMVEMGQGTYTSLPMLVAEELDVDMSNVAVEHSPPNDKLYGNAFLGGVQTTGNSSSIRAFYLPMRQAGAAARAMLIAAAAKKLGVDVSAL